MSKNNNQKQKNGLKTTNLKNSFWKSFFAKSKNEKEKSKKTNIPKNNLTEQTSKNQTTNEKKVQTNQNKKPFFQFNFFKPTSKLDAKTQENLTQTISQKTETKKETTDKKDMFKNLFGKDTKDKYVGIPKPQTQNKKKEVITIQEIKENTEETKTNKTTEEINPKISQPETLVKKPPLHQIEEKKNKLKKDFFNTKNFFGSLFKTKKEDEKKEKKEKKNMFVDLFPQEAEKNKEDSLIETIVEQSDQTQSILGQKLHNKNKENEPTKENTSGELLFWSQITLLIAFIIPITIYAFFHFQVTPESKILEMIGVENTGMLHQQKKAEREELKQKIATTKKNIAQLEETSKENLMEKTINQIKSNTNNWLTVMDHITEVTNQGILYNTLLKRLVYNSYNFSANENSISLSASLFDPNKQVFTLATSLIEAINRSDYFEGMENRSFSKTINEDGAKMSLSLNFTYIPEKDRENLTTVLEK